MFSTNSVCNFIEIATTHDCSPENSQHTYRIPSSSGTHSGVLFLYVKRILKDLNYKQVVIYSCQKEIYFTILLKIKLN